MQNDPGYPEGIGRFNPPWEDEELLADDTIESSLEDEEEYE